LRKNKWLKGSYKQSRKEGERALAEIKKQSYGLRLYRFSSEARDGKCDRCNWSVDCLYVLATSEEEAEELFRKGEAGLCGYCFSDMLFECRCIIKYPT